MGKEEQETNSAEFIRKIDHQSVDEPSGIFMAGLPGVGKTEFTVELIIS